jgi:hypothetical protein
VNKKILSLILSAGLTLPFLALADTTVTIGSMAAAIAGQVIIVGTWLVVIFWIVAGVLFLMAGGEPAKLEKAKLALFAAIGGTIVIILANSACVFVGNSFGISTSCG